MSTKRKIQLKGRTGRPSKVRKLQGDRDAVSSASGSENSDSEGSASSGRYDDDEDAPGPATNHSPAQKASKRTRLVGLEDDEDDDESTSDESDGEIAVSETPALSRTRIPPRSQQQDRSASRPQPKATVDITSTSYPPLLPAESSVSTDFLSLGVSKTLSRALNAMSIKRPTPVQAACIPPFLAGRDCIGNAKTGSGKTVAFAIPILQKLLVDPYGIFALVLTPTRELAFQISEQFAVLGSGVNVHTSVVVGGMDMMTQAAELRSRPHVVVATPGRLVDLMNSGNGEWDLSRVKFLVLDEADRLLTSTFADDLKTIFASLPTERQTGLFTATITPTIENLAVATPRPGKQVPIVHRDVFKTGTVDTLQQFLMLVPSHVREVYLYHLLCNPPESILHLRREPPQTTKALRAAATASKSKKDPSEDDEKPKPPPPTIIFVRHPKTAAFLSTLLQHLGIRATALHSYLPQPARLNALQLFKAQVVPVMVCTDVASRGLDMEGVGLVINWDLPTSKKVDSAKADDKKEEDAGDDVGGAEEYVHRVGRTARMGRVGVAVSFVTERREDEEMIKKIEQRISKPFAPLWTVSILQGPPAYPRTFTLCLTETELKEMTLPEDKVLLKLNMVSTAKRTASMELHDSDFGKRQEIHKAKKKALNGVRSR